MQCRPHTRLRLSGLLVPNQSLLAFTATSKVENLYLNRHHTFEYLWSYS